MKLLFLLLAGVVVINAAPAAEKSFVSSLEHFFKTYYNKYILGLQGCNEIGCNGHGDCVEDVCVCNEFGEGDEFWKYEGEFCEIGRCNLESEYYWNCFNGANCKEDESVPSGAMCVCPSDCPLCFDGDHCEFVDQCKIDFEQDEKQCNDHGYCTNDYTDDGFTCQCFDPHWMGEKCGDVNECYPNPCLNGGLCDQKNGTVLCECQDGFYGEHCENFDKCRVTVCLHQGICRLVDDEPVCDCTPHWEGDQCQIEITCDPDPCMNGGSCGKDRFGDKICYCPPGYTGKQCEHSACESNPCLNGGTCIVDGSGHFECKCHNGFDGPTCAENVCLPDHKPPPPNCHGHGNCQITQDGDAVCSCYPGWDPVGDCEERLPSTTEATGAPTTPAPTTQPQTSQPDTTQPQTTQPQTTPPATTQPPTTQPPTTQPETTQPPTTDMPTTAHPTTQPPTTAPPTTQPPTSQPPTSQPPTTTGTP